ncbi:hypothetical protein [uncultured Paludibaculum sp.]|uniref:hypothetical protein n=1 Tax=uncultured Paludibaculum sp. TaxID=1765020 RepID=UPI002AAC4275|nr:hypothetical protein [uncultured Paludibaculum sp.]
MSSTVERPRLPRVVLLVAAIVFLSCFVYCTAGGLSSWFSCDDLMNLHNSLSKIVLNDAKDDFHFEPLGTPELLLGHFKVWGSLERPAGQALYRAIYSIWGFSPLPYRVAAFAFLVANLGLLYLLARKLSGMDDAAVLVMLITGLNASFVSVYYDTGMIYDALCFFFYFGALVWYVHIRNHGVDVGTRQIAVLLCLFLLAVNSKEVGLSLPVALLCYELLWHPPGVSKTAWLRGPARAGLAVSLLAVLYVAGKFFGHGVMNNHAAYHPHLSVGLYMENYAAYLAQWSYGLLPATRGNMPYLLAALILLSFVTRRRAMIWAAIMIPVAILPLAFIPVRAGYAFYVPAVFWAIWLADGCAALVVWTFSRLPRCVPAARVTALVLVAGCLLPLHVRKFHDPLAVVHDVQNANRRYHDQLLSVLPAVPPGARLLVVNDPYPADGFDASFLIRLTYEDLTLRIDRTRFPWLAKKSFRPSDYDVVLDFVNDRFIVSSRRRP